MDVTALRTELSHKYINISANLINNILLTSNTELDIHADNCNIGQNDLITHIHEINGMPRTVNASVYDPDLESVKDKYIVDEAVAYNCPHSGKAVILKINQAIHINSMENEDNYRLQLHQQHIYLLYFLNQDHIH